MVNTIEAFQGQQKDIVIVSDARSQGIGSLNKSQKLSVALTRARRCLILFGDFTAIEVSEIKLFLACIYYC